MGESMSESSLTTYLAEHPRLIGVLFTLTVLLTQLQPVAAGVTACHGP